MGFARTQSAAKARRIWPTAYRKLEVNLYANRENLLIIFDNLISTYHCNENGRLLFAKRPNNLNQTASCPLFIKDLAVIQIFKPDHIQSIIFLPEIH
jgi:hypothetical protein